MTRTRLFSVLALCLLGLLAVACGSDGDEAAAVAGEFVGTASAQDAYVAISATEPTADGAFEVVAYVCNRQVPRAGSLELAEWFTGAGTGASVDLRSESTTSRLRATFGSGRVTGTVDLPDGSSMTFEAARSGDGPAGLFVLGLDDDGNLVGTSRGGKTLKVAPFEREGEPGYTGTITSPGGATVPYELFVRGGVVTKEEIAGMGTARTIILADGTSRGILDPIALRRGRQTTS